MKKILVLILFIFLCTPYLYPNKIKSKNNVIIASFNIQVFGKKKSSKPKVLDTIAKIVSIFDIIAIQEIQDKTGLTIKRLHSKIKKDYSYVIGPRVGYSKRRKEQYAYFYRKEMVEYISSYTYNDTLDEFSRDPFIAHFKLKYLKQHLVLINIHTPPKFALREIRKLPDVIEDAYAKYSEKNIILLGDFNADCAYFDENSYERIFPPLKYAWAIENKRDTTVSLTNCTYDRIVLTINMLKYYDFQSGVLKFNKIFRLPRKKALKISDHYPVWIKLIYEESYKSN